MTKISDEILKRGNIDEIMCAALGRKKIRMKIPPPKDSDVVVGKIFYTRDFEAGFFDFSPEVDTIMITYVRSGVAFYISTLHPENERSFPLGCIGQKELYPVVFETDLNPEFYEIYNPLGKTKIVWKS